MKQWMVALVFVWGCGGGGTAQPNEPTAPASPTPDTAPAAERTAPAPTHDATAPAANDGETEVIANYVPADPEGEPVDAPEAEPVDVSRLTIATGVPECDIPFNKYIVCIADKMPAESRDQVIDALEQSVDAWRQAAATPDGRKALAEACVAAAGAWQQSAEAIGCTW